MRDAQISRVALTVVFFLGLTLVTAGCTQPDQSYSSGALQAGAQIPSFAPVVRSVIPAVVNVSAVQKAGSPLAGEAGTASRANHQSTVRGLSPPAMDELLRKFFDNLEAGPSPNIPSRSIGSGFIIDRAGYIVTEAHVIENADKVTVTFQDGTKHTAHIIGCDPKTDLALLKIDTDRPLPFVDWGDSDTARVGDWVVAIGNPFGLDATVSSGIISGRGRDMHLGPYDDFLQIDAAINLGNSGGPTFDLSGRLIGINTAIYSPNGGSVGIGFAVPSKLAQPVIEQLKMHGTVERGWLGVRIQDLTPEIARAFGLPKPEGGLVADVTRGGPAAQAGFAQGDVILSANGQIVRRKRDLLLALAAMPIGQPANMTVWRRNAEIVLRPLLGTLTPVGVMPPVERRAQRTNTTIGLELGPLTVAHREFLGIPPSIRGVIVLSIDDDSTFLGLGIRPGDVIETINQQPVSSAADALAKLAQAIATGDSNVLMLVNRRGSNRYLAMSLEHTQASTIDNTRPSLD